MIVLIANYYYRAICYSNSSRSSILPWSSGASGGEDVDPPGSWPHCHAFHPISGRVRNAPKKVTRPPLGPLPPPNLHVTGPKNQNPMRRSAVRREHPAFIRKGKQRRNSFGAKRVSVFATDLFPYGNHSADRNPPSSVSAQSVSAVPSTEPILPSDPKTLSRPRDAHEAARFIEFRLRSPPGITPRPGRGSRHERDGRQVGTRGRRWLPASQRCEERTAVPYQGRGGRGRSGRRDRDASQDRGSQGPDQVPGCARNDAVAATPRRYVRPGGATLRIDHRWMMMSPSRPAFSPISLSRPRSASLTERSTHRVSPKRRLRDQGQARRG